MRLVAISDTHGCHEELELPEGDVLVHTGDFCRHGVEEEFRSFLKWFAAQAHPHKMFVVGNHDVVTQYRLEECRRMVPPSVEWLHDSGTVVAGLRFWGSPWTPEFCRWAWMLERGDDLRGVWDQIPDETEVLLTHGPAYGHGDLAAGRPPRAVGCLELLQAVRRVRPQLHVFGHIHEGYGISKSDEVPETLFANASTCTLAYRPENAPLVLDL